MIDRPYAYLRRYRHFVQHRIPEPRRLDALRKRVQKEKPSVGIILRFGIYGKAV